MIPEAAVRCGFEPFRAAAAPEPGRSHAPAPRPT